MNWHLALRGGQPSTLDHLREMKTSVDVPYVEKKGDHEGNQERKAVAREISDRSEAQAQTAKDAAISMAESLGYEQIHVQIQGNETSVQVTVTEVRPAPTVAHVTGSPGTSPRSARAR